MFFVHTTLKKNLKTRQSTLILDLCWTKTRSQKSRDYRDVIVFVKLCFQIVFRPQENEKPAFLNSSCLSRIIVKLRFREGLVWTVGHTNPSRNGEVANLRNEYTK